MRSVRDGCPAPGTWAPSLKLSDPYANLQRDTPYLCHIGMMLHKSNKNGCGTPLRQYLERGILRYGGSISNWAKSPKHGSRNNALKFTGVATCRIIVHDSDIDSLDAHNTFMKGSHCETPGQLQGSKTPKPEIPRKKPQELPPGPRPRTP